MNVKGVNPAQIQQLAGVYSQGERSDTGLERGLTQLNQIEWEFIMALVHWKKIWNPEDKRDEIAHYGWRKVTRPETKGGASGQELVAGVIPENDFG